MKLEDIPIDAQVDITSVVCPITFVKTKVALDELEDGQVLAVRLNQGEPIQNVPQSLKDEGHQVLKVSQNQDGTYRLVVRKNGLG
jgi:TusA-related sulfurtransferase